MEHDTAPRLHGEGESISKIQKIRPPAFQTQVQKQAGRFFGPQPLPPPTVGFKLHLIPCLEDKGKGSKDTGLPRGTFPLRSRRKMTRDCQNIQVVSEGPSVAGSGGFSSAAPEQRTWNSRNRPAARQNALTRRQECSFPGRCFPAGLAAAGLAAAGLAPPGAREPRVSRRITPGRSSRGTELASLLQAPQAAGGAGKETPVPASRAR